MATPLELIKKAAQCSVFAWHACDRVWDIEIDRALANVSGCLDEDFEENVSLVAEFSPRWNEVRKYAVDAEEWAYEVRLLLEGMREPVPADILTRAWYCVRAAEASSCRAQSLAARYVDH